jgi:hypothetical protein
MRVANFFRGSWILGFLLLSLALPLHAQDTARYAALVNEALGLYNQKQFHEAARKFENALTVANGGGRIVDRYNAACSWSLAGNADGAFRHLEWLAANPLFTRLDLITNDEDLRPLHGDPRWAPVVAAVRTNFERAEASRTHVGSFHYTRMMLLFNANADALNRRLPPGWVVSREGTNIVVGFCDVWASHDAAGRLVGESQVKYIPFNGAAWNMATGESTNIRYTEYADHPQRLVAASSEDVSTGDVVPSRIVRQSRIEHSDSLGDIYHEHWRIEPEGGGLIELKASFTHRVSWSSATSAMDVVFASNPARRLHYRNEEMHNIISRAGGENHLLHFEIKVDLPGWKDVFDGTEKLLSVRFIPTSKRDVFVYDRE